MNTTQDPIGNLQQLYEDVKKYAQLQMELVQVEFVEKMTIIISTLLIIGLIIILALGALFYLFFGLAYALVPLVGNIAICFVIVALIYCLLICILMTFRKYLVINPLVRFLSNLFLNTTNKD